MGVLPDGGGTTGGPEVVSVSTVGEYPVVTQHGVEVSQGGRTLPSEQLPGAKGKMRCEDVVRLDDVCLKDWDRREG